MTLILIDRDSIKLNPIRDNGTIREVVGPVIFTFKLEGGGDIPKHLLKKVDITEWKVKNGYKSGMSGYIPNPDDVVELLKVPGMTIEGKRDVQTYHSIYPEPHYLYKYIPTPIECSECKENILHTEVIEDEEVEIGDDYYLVDICPKCGAHNSFDYEYENIKDVKK